VKTNIFRRFSLDPATSLQRVASRLPFTYTGADLYALCSDAMLKAITRQARLVDQKVATHNKNLPPNSMPITIAHFFDHYATDEDTNVTVGEEDFDSARRELVPSVSYEELQHYEGVRKAFEGNGAEQKTIESGGAGPNHSKPLPPIKNTQNAATTQNGRRSSATRPSSRGKGREKLLGFSHNQQHRSGVEEVGDDDEDDPYTITTGHLSTNGKTNGHGKHPLVTPGRENEEAFFNGKGKGKGSLGFNAGEQQQGFGDAADEDEELYG
jgi:peroxin-6